MHIKSYFAASVEAAVELAGRELGPDALFLSYRPAPPEAQHLGPFEVVFGVDRSANPSAGAVQIETSGSTIRHRAGHLRRQVRALRASLDRIDVKRGVRIEKPSDIEESLVESGMDRELAGAIVRTLEQRAGARVAEVRTIAAVPKPQPVNVEQLWEWLPQDLASRIEVNPEIRIESDKTHVVALVGPAGAGKTTTIAKMACRFGLEARRSVQLISIDTQRIGAADQLHAYASILGVGFQALETARALEQALEEHRHKGLVMIDTAGYSAANMADAADLADLFARHPEIDTHLVLSAAQRTEDLLRTIRRFELFAPARLIFTNLDETESFGSLYGAAVRSGLPISFLSNGQSVPEDLEAATVERIVSRVAPARARRRESAA